MSVHYLKCRKLPLLQLCLCAAFLCTLRHTEKVQGVLVGCECWLGFHESDHWSWLVQLTVDLSFSASKYLQIIVNYWDCSHPTVAYTAENAHICTLHLDKTTSKKPCFHCNTFSSHFNLKVFDDYPEIIILKVFVSNIRDQSTILQCFPKQKNSNSQLPLILHSLWRPSWPRSPCWCWIFVVLDWNVGW